MSRFVLAALLVVAQARTTQDGVYTAAQAKRGESAYQQHCASCHAADLTGDGQATPLTGKEFTAAWSQQPLGDLFERIRTTMPADAPGSLKPADVADVVAFLLQKNAFPEGQSELPADRQALGITIVAPKP
jgi:mono/diheme cytochrome c family protein